MAEGISELRVRHESGETISLLCVCHDPRQCHRSLLAELILGKLNGMSRSTTLLNRGQLTYEDRLHHEPSPIRVHDSMPIDSLKVNAGTRPR